MTITETPLAGLLILTPPVFLDNRGGFFETYNERKMVEAGLPPVWPQDNFSISKKNVVRGIHYQVIQPQGKLVRVARGAAFDVAVDLRRSSPTFGKHFAIELSSENRTMLWIPVGFGHAFLALTEDVGFAYKVTDYYCAAGERTIAWNDAEIGISWPIAADDAILSDKDRKGVSLRDAEIFP
jgi:dTDP-4-dehydrorhamnose 3,5-epimerase